MKTRLIWLAVAALGSPADGQNEIFTAEERAQGEQTVQTAAAYFAARLREPSAATFRNVFLGKRKPPTPTRKIIVCGEVNGRNGFGGYTGFEPFIASGSDVYIGKVAGLSVQEACSSDRVFDSRNYTPELTAAVQKR